MTNATNLLEQLRVQKAQLDEKIKGLKVEQKQATQKQVEVRISEVIKALNPKTQFQSKVGSKYKSDKEPKSYTILEVGKFNLALTCSGKTLSMVEKTDSGYVWA